MSRRKKPAAPPDPPANSPEDLGYNGPDADYSPAQRAAFRETFSLIGKLQLELARRKETLGAAEDAADLAKSGVKSCQGEIEELGEKLFAIHKGTWQDELPGMEAGAAVAPAPPPTDEIPEELWDGALDHLAACIAKGKGLDANGLSVRLFGNRQAEHRPRVEQILQRLLQQGRIIADESDEKKLRYLPAPTKGGDA